MLDLERIPKKILEDISASLPLRSNGPEEIASMTAMEAMDAYLRYNGIIGFATSIIATWKIISAAEAVDVEPVKADLLEAARWVSRCPSIKGPIGTTAYIVSDARMKALRQAVKNH